MTDRRKAWLLKAMMITASASVLAACQTTSPYVERRQAESAPAPMPPTPAYSQPPAAPVTDPAPAAAPSGTISTQPLPPVQPAYTPPPAAYTPPAPAYTPPPPPPPPPPQTRVVPAQYKFVTTGKVVDADGPPQVYTVKSGDALDAIAKDMGLTRKELADLNDLKPPYRLQPGQKLTGPSSKAKAYTVGSGDTLSAIGRRFNVSAQALADANDFSLTTTLRPGQKVVLPSGYKDLGPQRVLVSPATTVVVSSPTPRAAPPAPPAATPAPPHSPAPASPPPSTSTYNRPTPAPAPTTPQPSTSVYSRPTPTPPAATSRGNTPAPAAPSSTAVRATPAQIQQLGRGQFIWPLRGRIITNFGTLGTAQRSDGINIGAATGTTVRASAAGTVLYAGPLPQYGNLVLVQHANGFVSVYAHLSRILVKTQAAVRQNQEIGEVGQTGDAAEPQLYFEMRYTGNGRDKPEAFDPVLVLPRQ